MRWRRPARRPPPFQLVTTLTMRLARNRIVFREVESTSMCGWPTGNREMLIMLLSAAVLLIGTAPARAQDDAPIDYETAHLERRLDALRIQGRIVIDGALDEQVSRDAPVAQGFIQNDPREGRPATYDTEVRVVYDDQALYFGVFAHDDDQSALIVSDLKKDFNLNTSDLFRIVIDTFDDKRNGYQFAVNPGGAKWDAQMSNEGRENNVNWDGIWDVRTRITPNGWYAEIWIPLRTLNSPPVDLQGWGVSVERPSRGRNEESYWLPLPRDYNLEGV